MSRVDEVPLQIAGYTILPLALPPLPSLSLPANHYLYISPHQPKVPTPTASRSLFLVNIPFDSTEVHIKALLSIQLGLPAGRIESVRFEGQRKRDNGDSGEFAIPVPSSKKSKKRKRGSQGITQNGLDGFQLPSIWDRDLQIKGLTAVVLFVDRASMGVALKSAHAIRKECKTVVWGEGVESKLSPLGSARYRHHHDLTYPNKTQLLNSVNEYMSAFTAKEAAQARLLARQRQEADEDGFITVTRGGRTNPARPDNAQQQAEKLKEKQQGLADFYRFQSREKRKEKAGELVKRFEEDKERVRKMKERRGRFRPE